MIQKERFLSPLYCHHLEDVGYLHYRSWKRTWENTIGKALATFTLGIPYFEWGLKALQNPSNHQ